MHKEKLQMLIPQELQLSHYYARHIGRFPAGQK